MVAVRLMAVRLMDVPAVEICYFCMPNSVTLSVVLSGYSGPSMISCSHLFQQPCLVFITFPRCSSHGTERLQVAPKLSRGVDAEFEIKVNPDLCYNR